MAAYPRIADDNLHVALEYSYLNQGPLDAAADFQPSCQLPYADCAAQAYRYSPMARSYSAPPSASMPSPSLMASRPRLHPDHPSSMVHQHFPGLQNLSGNTPTNTFSTSECPIAIPSKYLQIPIQSSVAIKFLILLG
ncbi:uncharacterized protein CDAR_557611 [Caerostris darwini]|uniref:Uncharacterized protein n=1 Tax=Caerostris darwini TaxID=1538125 RepID=A0AAV4TDD9_9ARAC|nr:uncharacterized protein CDAR_557611 [Caerostris darwini]